MNHSENTDDDVPSDEVKTIWHTVIGRVLEIASRPTNNTAWVPVPLRDDLQDCVDRGLLVATRFDENTPQDRYQLTVTRNGQIVYDLLHSHLVATGQVEPREPPEPDVVRANPFDGMDD